jgi:hypothetical protein
MPGTRRVCSDARPTCWRQRNDLVQSASRHILRMQKALTQMNVQLAKVLSDISGVTGQAITKAILSSQILKLNKPATAGSRWSQSVKSRRYSSMDFKFPSTRFTRHVDWQFRFIRPLHYGSTTSQATLKQGVCALNQVRNRQRSPFSSFFENVFVLCVSNGQSSLRS